MADRGFSKHFDGRRFYNPDAPQARGFLDGLRWKLTSRPEPWPPSIEDVMPSVPSRSVDASQVRVTMVNHSTLLIQSSGFNLWTDPVWSERASPVSWIGPKRRRRPGVRIDDLPSIDAVLISHNHFDHLDLPTLRQLATRGRSTFVVAAPCARLLCPKQSNPFTSCIWGESLAISGVNIHCVPALHFSARSILERNKILWCGYVIEYPESLVYFAGDTSFESHFRPYSGKFRLATACIVAHRCI